MLSQTNLTKNCREIALAMSGGVDSTAAALLLQDQGYTVTGFFMDLPIDGARERELRLQRVQEVAKRLHVPLHVIDLRACFHAEVILPFVRDYQVGRTPNPCCRCNPLLKFGALARAASERGQGLLATGHYARLRQRENHNLLLRAAYQEKDQSYFLAGLSAKQLKNSLFPLGGMNKEQAHQRAEAAGFSFRGEESQDVCFLSRKQVLSSFLQQQGLMERAGEVLAVDGRCLGAHRGIWHYTIGQRRGLGLPDATPWYVVGLDSLRNLVIVGKEQDLWQQECQVRDLHWIHGQPAALWQGLVQLRSRHKAASACLEHIDAPHDNKHDKHEQKKWLLRFNQPQRAITPGQFAVFYEGEQVMGCAVIDDLLV